MLIMSGEFIDMENKDVVVKQKSEIQVFLNNAGGISIAESLDTCDELIISFSLEDSFAITQAIIRLTEEHKNG